jgi:predicted RNase H-like HicB family nuclease
MAMKTHNFKVVLEPDEDFDGNPSGWHAYCPALERQGASTWGKTEDEALANINEVVRLVGGNGVGLNLVNYFLLRETR